MTIKAIFVYAADLGAVALIITSNGFNNIFSGTATQVDSSTATFIPKPTLKIDVQDN